MIQYYLLSTKLDDFQKNLELRVNDGWSPIYNIKIFRNKDIKGIERTYCACLLSKSMEK